MTNFLQRNYHELLLKYRKFSTRLDKKISNGSFWKLSNSKRALLLKRVEQLRKRLAMLESSLGKTAVAGAAALALSVMPALSQPWVENQGKNFFSKKVDVKIADVYSGAPSVVNLDGDADLDVVISDYYGNVTYFKNTGTASSPNFQEVTGTNNPFSALSFPDNNLKLSFADLDNDGDQDFLAGDYNSLSFFVNTGTASAPVFTQLTGTADPFASVDFSNNYRLSPQFVDIDNDGDKDVFVGDDYNDVVRYFQNTGNASIPSFTEQTGTNNPLSSIGYYANSFNMGFVDLDGDTDKDLFIGQNNGSGVYFKNTGTSSAPTFSVQSGSNDPFKGFDPGYSLTPAFADIDADGDKDFIYGSGNAVSYVKNTGSASSPAFTLPVNLGGDTNMMFVDLDNDGDHDVVFGNDNSSELIYYKNTGTDSNPNYVNVTGTANPLDNVSVNAYGSPTFADLDGDGDLDLVTGQNGGYLKYYKNIGTVSAGNFQQVTGVGFDNLNLGDEIVPFLVDIDNDGDADIFAGDEDYGFIQYLKNTGTASAPSFTKVTGTDNPFDTLDFYRTKPTFADIDGDGDFDLVLGVADDYYSNTSDQILYFKNVGTKSAPDFVYQTGTNNPFGSLTLTGSPAPAFFDLHADGDLDLYVADYAGNITLFENQKTISAVNVTDLSSEVNVYPNPASSSVTVKLGSSFSGDVKVEVLNMFGEVVSTSTVVSGSELNISVEDLASGVYYVKVVNGTQTGTKKIVKK